MRVNTGAWIAYYSPLMTPCPSFWQELIDQPGILGLASRKRLAGEKNVAASIEPHQQRIEDMHAIDGDHSIGDEKYDPAETACFLLAYSLCTDYHTQASCCWRVNLRRSPNDELCRPTH
jgi:hypothetical protein